MEKHEAIQKKIEELERELKEKSQINMKLQHEISVKNKQLMESGKECFGIQQQIQVLKEVIEKMQAENESIERNEEK
jgi:septal ring factor EnvC (AmiA/AmiB activator)